MSLKTIVTRKSIEAIKYGLFAIKGRAFDKIIKKQLDVVQNLDKYLSEEVMLYSNSELFVNRSVRRSQGVAEEDAQLEPR